MAARDIPQAMTVLAALDQMASSFARESRVVFAGIDRDFLAIGEMPSAEVLALWRQRVLSWIALVNAWAELAGDARATVDPVAVALCAWARAMMPDDDDVANAAEPS